jgi:hypothetical protein
VTIAGRVAIPLLIAAAAIGCHGDGNEAGDTPAGPGQFVAFAQDFQGVLDWPRFAVDRPPIPAIHDSGKYLVFINRMPPPGADRFPTGTIIVKIPQGQGDVFAMAKRGGDYNTRGAQGWEWFELKAQLDGSWVIAWRGITPPEGCGYSGIVGGGCNLCHASAVGNDYVQTTDLRLSPM